MKKKELIEKVSRSAKLTPSRTTRILDAFLDVAKQALEDGGTVELGDFGRFEAGDRGAPEQGPGGVEFVPEFAIEAGSPGSRHGPEPAAAGSENDEIDALTLLTGNSSVREAFLQLTRAGRLTVPVNPLVDPAQWKVRRVPTPKAIGLIAAVRTLWEHGYVSGVEPAGKTGVAVTVSPRALAVRERLEHIPDAVRVRVMQEAEELREESLLP